jgi:hypothetical protein
MKSPLISSYFFGEDYESDNIRDVYLQFQVDKFWCKNNSQLNWCDSNKIIFLVKEKVRKVFLYRICHFRGDQCLFNKGVRQVSFKIKYVIMAFAIIFFDLVLFVHVFGQKKVQKTCRVTPKIGILDIWFENKSFFWSGNKSLVWKIHKVRVYVKIKKVLAYILDDLPYLFLINL